MIILMGYIDVAPADRDAFLADARILAQTVRAEPGCLFHSLAPDIAPDGPMVLAQRWQDQAALDRHMARAATLAFREKWLARLKMNVAAYAVLRT